jgi:hypothetical protein
MLRSSMIWRRFTPRHSFNSRFTARSLLFRSAYAQQQPQPQSPHAFTSQLSGYPGVGGLPSFSVNSVPSALRSTRSLTSLDPFDTRYRPFIYPAYPVYPVYPESRREPRRTPIPFRIRTFEKHTPNPFGMRSFKTKDLKRDYVLDSSKLGRLLSPLKV